MRAPLLPNKKRQNGKPIPAPEWLAKRMETLRLMSPPSLKEVDIHFRASAEYRKRLTGKQRL